MIECRQTANTIYAWSRLAQLHEPDAALRARALERIQHNVERLLRRIGGPEADP